MESSRSEKLISGINLTNIIVLMIIAVLSYNVSSQVASLQSNAAENKRAKDLKEFWSEVEKMINSSHDISGKLGKSVARFQIAAAELAENYVRASKVYSNDLLANDLKYAEKYTSFINAYATLQTDIETAGIKYDFFRVKYHNLAVQYQLSGWFELLNGAEDMNIWKQKSLELITPYFQKLHQIAQEQSPSISAEKLQSILIPHAQKLGAALFIYQLPYADAAYEFMGENLIAYSKKAEQH